MKRYYLLWLLFLSVLFISSCAPVSFSDVKPGYSVIVHQPIVIKANDARVTIQDGEIIAFHLARKRYPHCRFVSFKRLDKPQVIRPGRFTIQKVRQVEYLANRNRTGFSVSALGVLLGQSIDVDYSTEMTLYSEEQPDIRELVCNHWEDPVDAEHLSWKQIQDTLRPLAEIEASILQ